MEMSFCNIESSKKESDLHFLDVYLWIWIYHQYVHEMFRIIILSFLRFVKSDSILYYYSIYTQYTYIELIYLSPLVHVWLSRCFWIPRVPPRVAMEKKNSPKWLDSTKNQVMGSKIDADSGWRLWNGWKTKDVWLKDIPFVPPTMSLLTTAFLTSVAGVAKIVLICAAGAYLEKAGILHKESSYRDESDSKKQYSLCCLFKCSWILETYCWWKNSCTTLKPCK